MKNFRQIKRLPACWQGLKRIVLILGWGMVVGDGFSQGAPGIEWAKCYGGSGNDFATNILRTSDDNFILSGWSPSNDFDVSGNHGNSDYWIVKTDSTGNLLWQKCYGGSYVEQSFQTIQSNNFLIVIGFSGTNNDGDVTGNHGYGDYWVVKLDSIGNIIWQKCLGGSNVDWGQKIIATNDAGFLAIGYSKSTDGDVTGNHGDDDCWIVKLDSLGNLIWQKSLGGSLVDVNFTIHKTNDNNYIIGGWTKSNDGDVSGNHGGFDYWVVKIDSSANILWQKCLGGSLNDYIIDIIQNVDSSYITIGWTYSNDGDVSGNHGGSDYWITKLDLNGNLIWQKCLGGSSDDLGYKIIQSSDHGFYAIGHSNSNDGNVSGNHGGKDYWVVKLDSIGNIIWQKCYGGNSLDLALNAIVLPDNKIVIAGASHSDTMDVTGSHGAYDYWIVQLFSDTITSVNDFQHSTFSLQLFPNPTTGIIQLNISTKHNAPLGCEIINMMGEKVFTSPLTPLQRRGESYATLDVSFLAKGIYLVRVGNGERWENKKLVIE